VRLGSAEEVDRAAGGFLNLQIYTAGFYCGPIFVEFAGLPRAWSRSDGWEGRGGRGGRSYKGGLNQELRAGLRLRSWSIGEPNSATPDAPHTATQRATATAAGTEAKEQRQGVTLRDRGDTRSRRSRFPCPLSLSPSCPEARFRTTLPFLPLARSRELWRICGRRFATLNRETDRRPRIGRLYEVARDGRRSIPVHNGVKSNNAGVAASPNCARDEGAARSLEERITNGQDSPVTRYARPTHNSHCISNIIVEISRGSNGRSRVSPPRPPVTIKRRRRRPAEYQYRAKKRITAGIAGRVAALIARFRRSHL